MNLRAHETHNLLWKLELKFVKSSNCIQIKKQKQKSLSLEKRVDVLRTSVLLRLCNKIMCVLYRTQIHRKPINTLSKYQWPGTT